jgi:hypothetical protein
MSTINNASSLLSPGETAIVIFTKGKNLELDLEGTGTGTTGNWITNPRRRVDKVIVYRRDPYETSGESDVFIGEHAGLVGPNENGRYIVKMRGVVCAGTTQRNWYDFADAGTNPIRYLTKT